MTRHEHDHAPIPRSDGGVVTVAACVGCHHLKDRVLFEHWPLALYVMAVQELAEHDAIPTTQQDAWPDCWDDLSGHARLAWAKVAAVASRAARVDAVTR